MYFGGPNSLSTYPDRIWTGENEDDQFGTDVTGLGDLNGDGFIMWPARQKGGITSFTDMSGRTRPNAQPKADAPKL